MSTRKPPYYRIQTRSPEEYRLVNIYRSVPDLRDQLLRFASLLVLHGDATTAAAHVVRDVEDKESISDLKSIPKAQIGGATPFSGFGGGQ